MSPHGYRARPPQSSEVGGFRAERDCFGRAGGSPGMDHHPPALGRLRCFLVALLALGLVGCDHATKIAAKATLEGASAIPIAPDVLRGAVELRYAANDDIAFSAFHRLGVPHPAALLIGV